MSRIDLTQALYLGLAHPHRSLAPWDALTTGRPAALDAEPAVDALCRDLARLLGLARATLAPSTLHVVTDLYAALPDHVREIHVATCSYAITRWGLERARLRGVAIYPFATLSELECRLGRASAIVCDSVCVPCRRIAPLRRLQQLASATGGWLIVDDSQGLGLLGRRPSRALPYGSGGGGTLHWADAHDDRVIAIGSCAKAFGVPLAFVAGSARTVEWFEEASGTRTHASPCNAADLTALDAALRINADRGDELRARLLDRVRRFRASAALRGGVLEPGAFPIQVTPALRACTARAVEARLARRGVRVLRLRAGAGRARLGFAITSAHDRATVDAAGAAVADALAS